MAAAAAAAAALLLTVLLPQMNGDVAEPAPVWERPWSLDEIRKGSQSWSLASDAGVSGAAGTGPEPGTGGVRGPPPPRGWDRVRGGAAARWPRSGRESPGGPAAGRTQSPGARPLSRSFKPPIRAGKLK